MTIHHPLSNFTFQHLFFCEHLIFFSYPICSSSSIGTTGPGSGFEVGEVTSFDPNSRLFLADERVSDASSSPVKLLAFAGTPRCRFNRDGQWRVIGEALSYFPRREKRKLQQMRKSINGERASISLILPLSQHRWRSEGVDPVRGRQNQEEDGRRITGKTSKEQNRAGTTSRLLLAQRRMPMRSKTPTPLLFPKGKHKKAESEYDWSGVGTGEQTRKVSVIGAIRRAAKKVFAIIFLGQKKLKPGEWRSDPGESSTLDTESTLSGWTGYSSPSSFGRSTERKVSGQYRFSGSRFQKKGKDSSSTKSWHLGPVVFSFGELQRATANFAPVHQIGEGGFGTVYKGRLDDGTFVAIKRARKNNYGKSWLLEFKNEIYTLSKIEHMNLVKLYGFLEHEDERVIVVEYVGNGNLREHLDGLRGNRLETAERLEIAIDVAHALTYLHTYTDTPIIHRDIKASNILITDKLRAKVADFGFARLVSEEPGATHVSTQVKGSAGYVDPDYLRTFQLTDKSDVYSFGILLIELITGRRPIELKRPRKDRFTVKWALRRLKDDEAVLVMDPLLKRNRAAIEVAEKMLKLANECVAPTRATRPSMKCCAEKLWAIRREMKETMVSSSPSVSSSSSATHSFVGRDSDRYALPRIIDDENSIELVSP